MLDRRRRTPASTRCSSSTCRRPGRPRRAHPGVHPHHRPPPPDRRVRGRARPGQPAGRRRGRRHDVRYEWFRFERLMIAARCLGAAERLVDETTAFAPSDGSCGRAAGRQAARAGDARRQPDRAVRRALDGLRGGPRDRRRRRPSRSRTPSARWPSSTPREMAGRVADRAVQIFGGRGYMRENVAERFFRELRVERIWEGASEIQRVDHRRPAGQARRPRPDLRPVAKDDRCSRSRAADMMVVMTARLSAAIGVGRGPWRSPSSRGAPAAPRRRRLLRPRPPSASRLRGRLRRRRPSRPRRGRS